MNQEHTQYKKYSLSLCEKLINDLKRNREDADTFLGGELYKAYVNATEKAINKAQRNRNQIRKL